MTDHAIRPAPGRGIKDRDSKGLRAALSVGLVNSRGAWPAKRSDVDVNVVNYPRIPTILKHLSLNLLVANVVPAALFYLCLRLGDIWIAIIVALTWCYGVIGWRKATKRRTSGLLILTVVGLTAKTILALASRNMFIYFIQPAANDAIIAVLFLVSLATARPIVARMAADFYPMSAEVAGRPRIRRLFRHLTLFWALLCLTKSGITVWLLESLPPVQFVAIKSVSVFAIILVGTAMTVEAARRVAKTEGLLHRTHLPH